MAAITYLADNYTDPMPEAPGVGIEVTREFLFTVSIALLVTDIIKLCPFAKGMGVVLDNWFLDVPDLDGGANLMLQLGDTNTAARYMAANSVGQAGGKVAMMANGVAQAVPVEYPVAADKDLRLTVQTAGSAVTGVAIRGWVTYHFSGIRTPVYAD